MASGGTRDGSDHMQRRCVNCSFTVPQRQPVHSLDELSNSMLNVLCSWITPDSLEALRSLAFSAYAENTAYSHSVITITPYLNLEGGKKDHLIVGYTDDAVIMLGDKKVGKEAHALRPNLFRTHDSCRQFIESTDGIVFSSTNFHKMNGEQQKQFIQTATAAIHQRMLHESRVQDCVCTYIDPFRARSVCFSKDKKEVARRRK